MLAAVTAAAFAGLQPSGEDIGNSEILRAAKIAGWVIGPVAGLLSLLKIGILNLIRRLLRLRKVEWLHPVVVLLGIMPWLVLGWIITGEPRYTPIARAVIDFAAHELLWGGLVACVLTLILSIPLLFPKKP